MRKRGFVGFTALLLCVAAIGCGERPDPRDSMSELERLATEYGLDDFHTVKRLSYVFNYRFHSMEKSRRWDWEPHEDRVRYRGPGPNDEDVDVTYVRGEPADVDSALLSEVDKWFINDNYWLIFPIRAAWDTSIQWTFDGIERTPISAFELYRITIRYPDDGGYTPGDMYQLYYAKDDHIYQWAYFRGGADEPTVAAAWYENRRVGPLLISIDRRATQESFYVWFTDVEVETMDGEVHRPVEPGAAGPSGAE